ncbi:hypothetical protein EYF80_067728 [Liparis tanakae]|uniref:Uncharacterized protein n=1 Tax=Liparis tanakae TaxID=230148 RepID=A0A4Z2E0B3_9TELE|nr:hypothetical protein EYF80_067728 [Liparis tanakae]
MVDRRLKQPTISPTFPGVQTVKRRRSSGFSFKFDSDTIGRRITFLLLKFIRLRNIEPPKPLRPLGGV